MDRSTEKKRSRARSLARRDGLTAKQRRDYSGRIIKTLTCQPYYTDADAILTYVSFRSEVDTFPLLEQALADGKAVFVPKVLGKEMEFYRIFSPADLSAGYQGILEPVGEILFQQWKNDQLSQQSGCRQKKSLKDSETEGCEHTSLSALICMPGAAFDRERHRIGYGGGFYDRYVSRLIQDMENADAATHPQARFTTAALAYDCQIFEEIPWEAHDVRPMYLITEKEII